MYYELIICMTKKKAIAMQTTERIANLPETMA